MKLSEIAREIEIVDREIRELQKNDTLVFDVSVKDKEALYAPPGGPWITRAIQSMVDQVRKTALQLAIDQRNALASKATSELAIIPDVE